MKELYFDWWVKVVPASPLGRRDYPNLGMCGGSVSLNPYLSLDSIGSFEGKQAVNQTCFTVCLFFFLWALWTFSFPGLGMNTVSRFSFSQLVEMTHTDFQWLPTPAFS